MATPKILASASPPISNRTLRAARKRGSKAGKKELPALFKALPPEFTSRYAHLYLVTLYIYLFLFVVSQGKTSQNVLLQGQKTQTPYNSL